MWFWDPSFTFKCPLSPSQLSLPPSLLGADGSPVLGKAIPLTDTPAVFPTHTHPDTPLSNIEPEYFEGTCLLTQRGKMQVVTLRINSLACFKSYMYELWILACMRIVYFIWNQTWLTFWVSGQLSLMRPDFTCSEKIMWEQDYGQLTF